MDPLDIRRTRPAKSNAQQPYIETASQTAGPYVHIGCAPHMVDVNGLLPLSENSDIREMDAPKIHLSGTIYDGANEPVKDGMLEFWQPHPNGSFSEGLWQRAMCDLEIGQYQLHSCLPQAPNGSSKDLAPSIHIWIAARGINLGLHSRLYFPQFATQNARDPLLALVPDQRCQFLMAKPTDQDNIFKFDIYLQGDKETPFFDV